jgi:nucleoside-diphosphate-sugar epimerase
MITGGTGFLGSYLARHLVQEKGVTDLVLFDRFPDTGRIAEIADRVTLVRGDVLEPQEILEAMDKYNVDRVVHLAFLPGLAEPGKLVPYLRVQCMGTANVFEAARIHGIKRVCNASSMAVYGRTESHPVTEDDPPTPREPYGVCKLWTEGVAEAYNRTHGMEIISLRVCASLGLGRLNRASLASGLMTPDDSPHFMAYPELAALGQPVTMPPDDEMTDFIYAADGAEAWWLALNVERPAHFVFNLCAGQRRIGDMTAHLRRLLPDAEIGVRPGPPRPTLLMDNTRLVTELGFEPRYTLESGLEDYLNRVRRAAGPPDVARA